MIKREIHLLCTTVLYDVTHLDDSTGDRVLCETKDKTKS